MNASDKEKIYEELRNYHTNKLPEKVENPMENDIKNEFISIEDRIVMMLVRFVNDKDTYVDFASELESFKTRLESIPESENNKPIKNILFLKFKKLVGITLFAKELNLRLKRLPSVA